MKHGEVHGWPCCYHSFTLTRHVRSPAERISEMLGNLQHKCRPKKVGMNPAKGSLTIPMGLKHGIAWCCCCKQSAMKLISVNNGWVPFNRWVSWTLTEHLKWSPPKEKLPTNRSTNWTNRRGPLRMEQVNLHGTLILRNSSTCGRQIVDKRSRWFVFHDVFSKVRINIMSKCLQATPRYCKKYLL